MQWSNEKPTNAGWYWVRDSRRYGVAHVRQDIAFDGQKYLWVVAMYPNHGTEQGLMMTWGTDTEWAGPIESPFVVDRLCKWELGCNIPMPRAINAPESLCLWHQACLKTDNPQETARDFLMFETWLAVMQLVVPVPAPWWRTAEVLFAVTVGKREVIE